MNKALEQLFVEIEPCQEVTEATTEPASVLWQGQNLQDASATPSQNADRADGGGNVERSSSFTLPEPSQLMREHLQRRAEAEAHFQRGETVRSRSKEPAQKKPPRQQMDQTSLEQEIDRMIERTLNEHNVAPSHMEGLRNYLRRETQRDQRVSQLVRYQQEERQRMQQEFERQQKYLIQEICSEMDLSLYGDSSSETEEQPAEGSSPQEDEPREPF